MLKQSTRNLRKNYEDYEECFYQFARQWACNERDLHKSLSRKRPTSDEEPAIRDSLKYFGVARSFKNRKEKYQIIEKIFTQHSKGLNKKNFVKKVVDLSNGFKKKGFSTNLSAASKLLWLRTRSPVIIYDKNAFIGLKAMRQENTRKDDYKNLEKLKEGDYVSYVEHWNKEYENHENMIREVSNRCKNKITQNCDGFSNIRKVPDWFCMRVFDLFLFKKGQESRTKEK